MSASEFQRLLEAGNVDGLMLAWSRLAPHLPQPRSREAAEITMHMARTASASVHTSARQYSHRWLVERGHPSQLPEALIPPRIVEAVGISVSFRSVYLKPAALEVRGAMETAVNECYADGRTDATFVRQRMDEAKAKTLKVLFG